MFDKIQQLHPGQDLAYFSNLAHWVEGYILLAVAIVSFFAIFRNSKRLQFLSALLILLSGAFLAPYLLLHHGVEKLPIVLEISLKDAQQRQHLIMGILLAFSGIGELQAVKDAKKLIWKIVFPLSLMVVGSLFVFHPQHGTPEAIVKSMNYHTYLG